VIRLLSVFCLFCLTEFLISFIVYLDGVRLYFSWLDVILTCFYTFKVSSPSSFLHLILMEVRIASLFDLCFVGELLHSIQKTYLGQSLPWVLKLPPPSSFPKPDVLSSVLFIHKLHLFKKLSSKK